jgi:FkbM family methyltransferase
MPPATAPLLTCRIGPGLYGSRARAIEGITSAEIRLSRAKLHHRTVVVPSAAGDAHGAPRFRLLVPVERALNDVSAWLLMAYEHEYEGYEAPYRLFLAAHVEPGDVFVDVGAHWGLYAVDVATRTAPDVAILACEPVAENLEVLRATLRANQVEERVEVIPAALADFEGEAWMIPGNAMTARLARPDAGAGGPGRFAVRTVTLDRLLRERPALAGRRLFLKVDAEGAEPAVLRGARATLDAGNVAAIIVEYHPGRERPEALSGMLEALRQRGYRLARFPHHHMGGALLDFAPDDTVCNVIAAAPGLRLADAYATAWRGFAPLPPPYYHEMDLAQRARRDAILREWRATDGARWSDPRNAAPDAPRRARLAAAHVRAGERVLDLGAGAGALREALPPGCNYVGVDLIAHHPGAVLVDLNRAAPPESRQDHVVASRLIEHLYEPAPLLRWCAAHAARLTCIDSRPGTGEDLVALLHEGGWRVLQSSRRGDELACFCEAL